MLQLDPRTTALVLIDLQKGVVAMPSAPRSTSEVIATAIRLAQQFRKAKSPVVLVTVEFARDYGDALRQSVDKPSSRPAGGMPEGWTDLADGLVQPTDIRVTKHQWGAFYGTDLDVQLRRRGITTIVLGGVATNMGVESTARQAWERGYAVVIAEDATAGHTPEMHAFAVRDIFPRISRVVAAADISLG